MLTLPVWPFLTFGGSAFCPFTLKDYDTDTIDTNVVKVYDNSRHKREDNSNKIGEVMKIGGLEVSMSQSMCA